MNKVTILRKWDNPQITINVTNEEISLEMSLDAFVRALTDEVAEPLVKDVSQLIGNPTFLVTNAMLQKKMVYAIESQRTQAIFIEATQRIIEEIKKETVKVM